MATPQHSAAIGTSVLTMNGKFVPEDTYLQLYSEFRKLKEKTMQECKVVEVFIRKESFDVVLPILRVYNDPKRGTTVIVGEGSAWNNQQKTN